MSRLLILAAATAALLALAGCGRRVVQGPPAEGEPLPPRTVLHEVEPGETLPEIADAYYGDPDRAERIAADNGLTEPERLVPGSRLLLRFSRSEWERAQRRAAAREPYNRGVRLLEEGRLEEAEAAFRDALAVAPGFHSARYNLALTLSRRGQLVEARTLLRELVDERPEDPDFLFALGHVLFQEGSFDAAADVFGRLLAVAPDHRRGAFGRARALQEGGHLDEARAAWLAYLELDDTSGWADTARRNLEQLSLPRP